MFSDPPSSTDPETLGWDPEIWVLTNSLDDAVMYSSLGATGYKNKVSKIENKIYEWLDRLDGPKSRAIMP